MVDRTKAIAALTREVIGNASTADLMAYLRALVYEGFLDLSDQELAEQLAIHDLDPEDFK